MTSDAPAAAPVLYVEDDENDSFLMQHAFRRLGVSHPLRVVADGREALDYLSGGPPFSDRQLHPLPRLLLIDLNMPRVNGFDVLKWVRGNPQVSHLLIVVLSSSNHKKDMDRAYAMGANAYFVKPPDVASRLDLVTTLRDQWLK